MPGGIFVDGEAVVLSGPRDATACRIGMVHQHFKLVKPFTVAENVLLANRRGRFAPGFASDRATDHEPSRRARLCDRSPQPRRRAVDRRAAAGRDHQGAGRRAPASSSSTSRRRCSPTTRLSACSRRCATLAARGAAVVLVTHKLARGDRVHRPGHGHARRASRRDARFALNHGQRTDPAYGRHERRSAPSRLVASRRDR